MFDTPKGNNTMQILTEQVPPSGQPAASPTPTHTSTTTTPAEQLPITGRSDVAQGALAIGLPMLVVGAVLIVALRRRRVRTG